MYIIVKIVSPVAIIILDTLHGEKQEVGTQENIEISRIILYIFLKI